MRDTNDERRSLARSAAQDVVHRDEAIVRRNRIGRRRLEEARAFLHHVIADDPRALARHLARLALDYNDDAAVLVAALAISETPRIEGWVE